MAGFNDHLLVRMPAARAVALWARSRGLPPPSRATVARWITSGIGGIRLNAERYGARWFCRPADVLQFHARIGERRGGAA